MKLREFLQGVTKIKVQADHLHEGKQVLIHTGVLSFSHESKEYRTVTYGSVTFPLDIEINNFCKIEIGGNVRRAVTVWMGALRMTIDPVGQKGENE